MKTFITIILLNITAFVHGQNIIAIIKDEGAKQPLPGISVRIKTLNLSAVTNDKGVFSFNNIPPGKHDIEITGTGFKEFEQTFTFPLASSDTIQIFLEQEAATLDEVTVSSTRSGRSVKNTPTRVEVIAEEEINEEAAMRPGDIRMLLAESTGIQTQQTSATSANASIRIQGLDGRYTQILKDGFPIYSGAANGLGLLQTPPLDLKQVEIIKGSSSTLYGGGAVAGLINLISKTPAEKKELNFNVNVTSAGGLDVNSFYSQRFKKVGVTLFVSRNSNKAYDPAGIFFTAIPKFERYTVNPKFFLYFNEKTKLNFGINSTFENRLGGDIKVVQVKGDIIHSYFERNKTQRLSTQFSLDHQLNKNSRIVFKNSIGSFNRFIESNNYIFDGNQLSSFSEATYVSNHEKTDWVTGLNVLTDHFTEKKINAPVLRDYDLNTFGAFVQNTFRASALLTLETGLRGDYIQNYGFVLLPRISALFKITPKLTSRIGGGFGYKAPTIFTEESERLLYKNVLPIDPAINKTERSYGANMDVTYRTTFDKITFSVNQFFFYTYLKDPLFLAQLPNGASKFINTIGNTNTKGAETNIKLGYDKISLYLGYTFIDAKNKNAGVLTQNPLTPKHRINTALVYDIEDKWRFGSELYYFDKQIRNDGTTGRHYWLTGLVAERFWKNFSVYINFENFGDVRQTKFESIFTGTVTNPVFKDIYAPLEGFVVNGGLKFKF